jgi:hypothetical protein
MGLSAPLSSVLSSATPAQTQSDLPLKGPTCGLPGGHHPSPRRAPAAASALHFRSGPEAEPLVVLNRTSKVTPAMIHIVAQVSTRHLTQA